MIPTQKMSAYAEAAAERYGHLIAAFRSLYQSSLNANDFGSARQMENLLKQAYTIAHAYMNTERTVLHGAFEQIASDARRTTLEQMNVTLAEDSENDAGDTLESIYEHLLREIAIQIERDIVFLGESLRRAWLQVRLAARSKGISTRAALGEFRIGASSDLQFFFHDRGNAKWPSRKFVRAVTRHHLLNAYNEVVLTLLADHGFEIAEVEHVNPNADSNGMQIAMSPGSELPTYAEIRNEIFHPNSDAIVRKAS